MSAVAHSLDYSSDRFTALLGAGRGSQKETLRETPELAELADAGVYTHENEHVQQYVAAAKIPLSDLWPDRGYYVAALHEQSLCPTPDELELLRGYIETVTNGIYLEHLAAQMLQAPYAGDSGHNTNVFSTRADDEWPFAHGDGPKRLSLLELLDHIERRDDHFSPRWQAWRDINPQLCA
jgi:hypothetical protein